MKRYILGWEVFCHAYNLARFKAHGAKSQSMRNSIFLARCARWIAAQQHQPWRNPYFATARGGPGHG